MNTSAKRRIAAIAFVICVLIYTSLIVIRLTPEVNAASRQMTIKCNYNAQYTSYDNTMFLYLRYYYANTSGDNSRVYSKTEKVDLTPETGHVIGKYYPWENYSKTVVVDVPDGLTPGSKIDGTSIITNGGYWVEATLCSADSLPSSTNVIQKYEMPYIYRGANPTEPFYTTFDMGFTKYYIPYEATDNLYMEVTTQPVDTEADLPVYNEKKGNFSSLNLRQTIKDSKKNLFFVNVSAKDKKTGEIIEDSDVYWDAYIKELLFSAYASEKYGDFIVQNAYIAQEEKVTDISTQILHYYPTKSSSVFYSDTTVYYSKNKWSDFASTLQEYGYKETSDQSGLFFLNLGPSFSKNSIAKTADLLYQSQLYGNAADLDIWNALYDNGNGLLSSKTSKILDAKDFYISTSTASNLQTPDGYNPYDVSESQTIYASNVRVYDQATDSDKEILQKYINSFGSADYNSIVFLDFELEFDPIPTADIATLTQENVTKTRTIQKSYTINVSAFDEDNNQQTLKGCVFDLIMDGQKIGTITTNEAGVGTYTKVVSEVLTSSSHSEDYATNYDELTDEQKASTQSYDQAKLKLESAIKADLDAQEVSYVWQDHEFTIVQTSTPRGYSLTSSIVTRVK